MCVSHKRTKAKQVKHTKTIKRESESKRLKQNTQREERKVNKGGKQERRGGRTFLPLL